MVDQPTTSSGSKWTATSFSKVIITLLSKANNFSRKQLLNYIFCFQSNDTYMYIDVPAYARSLPILD